MTVLLVNPPTLGHLSSMGLLGQTSYFEYECSFTSQYWYKSYPGEHMGLMALLAYLRREEIPAACVNGQTELHRSLDATWNGMLDAASSMGGRPRVVGFSGPCQVFEENAELASRARRQWPDAHIVMGHHFATLNHRRILEEYPQFDSISLGDGELSISALARGTSESDLSRIDGLAWRDASGAVRVQPQAAPLELDDLPWTARDELRSILRIGVSPGISTSRGCPYRCSYCTTGQTAGMLHKRFGYRQRSVEPVLDEIGMLIADYDIPHLTITDDLFVVKTPESLERAHEFARGYRRRGYKVPFMLDCRLDSADPDVFRDLAAAGCYRVFVGIETGSTEQLAFYNKRYGSAFDPAYVGRRVGALQSFGIEVIPGILTYHPATTHEELRATLDIIDACGYESTWQFLCDIFAHPGTALYRSYQARGWLDKEWPVPSWSFQDPHAEVVRQRVLAAVKDGGGHVEARAAFQLAVEEWSRGELSLDHEVTS
jgi:radical SAM superfamily enzyme YgiQ (UPF0313 family)